MSNLLLVMDIGNTSFRMGVYKGKCLIGDWRFSIIKKMTEDEIGNEILYTLDTKDIHLEDINAVVISCVVPSVIKKFRNMCGKYLNMIPVEIDPGREEYLPLGYSDPSQIGADRVVSAVAGIEKYGTPLVIIDFGTATTFNVISKEGELVGGCIAPGIGISFDALLEHAERLHAICLEVSEIKSVIARSTDEAMSAGLLYGYGALVDGLVQRIKYEMRCNPKVVATGGWLSIIKDEARSVDVFDPNLTLEGLRIIYAKKQLR